MTEPIGWSVYYSGNGNDWTFREFVPNEPELAAEAEKMADEVEQFVAENPDKPAAYTEPPGSGRFWSSGPSLVELDAYGDFAPEYRQSATACCPRETIPDSCSCLEGCGCLCRDCDCGDDEDG